mmetsp:Transcript_58978/g.129220  ORF Transcript_58978/g.129220 Transcript_58978/m.129220 type:complete len:480 (+) Transcript_58978:77-1516(+)
MCTPQTQRRAKNAWNGWLDERDLAPGEVISNWLKRHTQRGLALAAEYAKAGYDKALERADQAWAARSLLDSGSPAQEAIDVKQQCDKAVAADAALLQMLKELSTQYAEEAKFPKDADSGKAVALWASRYGRAAEMLTVPSATPATPQRSAVEQDAMTLQQLRQAQAHMTNKLLGTTPLPAGAAGTGYAGATSSRSSASSASKAKAQERVEELLQKLFDLHDLKANGVLEEEELIKMNEKVSLLHYGKEKTDKNAIREKFRGVFREQLDPQGRPVPFSVFRNYMQGLLLGVDADPEAQVMMVEQFIAEAETARQAFRIPSLASESDHLFLPAGHPAAASPPANSAPRGGKPSTLADRVAHEEAARQGGSLPVGRQPESEPGLSQAGDQPATFGPSSSRSNETGGSKETGSLPFQKGERLQVWSNSKNSWRNGEVLEAFPVACKAEGFAVPAGTLKVSFDAGTIKWVMPGQATAILRKAPS